MRILLSRPLLAYLQFDLNYVNDILNINYNEVDDLCRIFYHLVAQLPPHITVFYILDSISFFEEDEVLSEESELVLRIDRYCGSGTRPWL
jgi:hypothetical protein